MHRGRSRSDSPTINVSEIEVSGCLICHKDSFMSKVFERTVTPKTLSRLKARKRFWYVLDNSKCQLLFFKNESDSQEGKEPLGAINIKGAAISLALEENNQFVIHSEGKEHVLVADNHESMMLWIVALQAKQDFSDDDNKDAVDENATPSLKKSTDDGKNIKLGEGTKSKTEVLSKDSKARILRTHSLQLNETKATDIKSPAKQHNPLTRMRSLWSGHSVDTGFASNTDKDRASSKCSLPPVAQSLDIRDEDKETEAPTAPVTTAACSTSNSSTISKSSSSTISKSNSKSSSSTISKSNSKSSSSNSNCTTPSPSKTVGMGIRTDPNNNGELVAASNPEESVTLEEESSDRSTDTESCDENSDGTDDSNDDLVPDQNLLVPESEAATALRLQRVRLLRKMNSDGLRPEDIAPLSQRPGSFSTISISSDSAMGTSDCGYSLRFQELETELMSAKCDLAIALNKESSYKAIIDDKNSLIAELEERLRATEEGTEDACKPSSSGPNTSSRYNAGAQKLEEKCRILQNQNRFLNEEVLKLSKMLQHEQNKYGSQQMQLRKKQAENEQLRRDYVFLLQSALRITNSDGPEKMEVYLYGGARHKERVLSLLDEARMINPTLPSYDKSSERFCHVDPLGFRRSCTDESLALHYICRQLHQHYGTTILTYELHQQRWKKHLKQNPTLPRTKELKALVRDGVPAHLRSRVWVQLYKARVKDIMEDKGSHYYSYLCSLAPDEERISQHRRQIGLDLLRTMPDNIRFSDTNADGVRKMQEVLQAFCLHNPSVGYCQGMNFLVGMCLLFLEPEDAFWCLVAITERYFTPNYFDQNLIGAQADQEVLKDLMKEKMPYLWRHLMDLDIELCTVTLNWFLAVFFDCVPFETLLRIWDCFLLEGPKVLFRFSLAILLLNKQTLFSKHDTVSIMRQLKASAKLCFDVDSLFKVAFEGLKPFTRRQDIAAKQACYYKTLKEHAKKMELEKVALKDKERMLSEMEILSGNQLVIECAAVYDRDKLWLCHGHQNGAQITKVNCEESIMYRLNIQLDSRVMCMHSLDDDTMLLGTLSHFVHAYSTRSRRLMWETRLNDSVLALSSYEEDDVKQVYAGLADGTIAVIENVQSMISKPEIFYIMLGSSPITCIRLIDRRLWCGSGNRVIILSARTLDTVDQFQTSSSVLDYISMLVPDEQGVWVTIRGSSILQLWDAQTLTCKLLYDVKDNKYPRSPKQQEEDTNIPNFRITAVLPFGDSVLVGTAEGSLIIYDLIAHISRSASSADFAHRKQLENTTVDHIQERIQELLREQKKHDDSEPFGLLRNRTENSCYLPHGRTSMYISNRRESSLMYSENLPPQLENDEAEKEEEQKLNEADSADEEEDHSETTSASTVKRTGEVISPESHTSEALGQPDDHLSNEIDEQPLHALQDNCCSDCNNDDADIAMAYKRSETDRDSGRSSSSTQGKLCDDLEDLKKEKLCTCHQLNSKTVKCHHCLLETSEALRELFNKYSLGTSQSNFDSTMRYQNFLNASRNKMALKYGSRNLKEEQVCNGKVTLNDSTDEDTELRKDDDYGLSESSLDSKCNKNDHHQYENRSEDDPDNNSKKNTPNHGIYTSVSHGKKNNKNSHLLRAISADDVTRWIKSQETLTSSFASDSYDFDDIFVTYTEDEGVLTNSNRYKVGARRISRDSDPILESLRTKSLLNRRRSSNIYDYTVSSGGGFQSGGEPWQSSHWWKSRSSSPYIFDTTSLSSSSTSRNYRSPSNASLMEKLRILDVRNQLPPWNPTNSECSEIDAKLTTSNGNSSNKNSTPSWLLSCEDSGSINTENESSSANNKGPLSCVSKDILQMGEWSSGTQKGSDTASNVSFCSTEVPYVFELSLQEKIKISDKPIKCLLETRCGGEPTIISCAGCYGDDEAVLKWTKLGDEKLWTNDPIIEVCPYTNAIKPSPYVRSRLPKRTASLASMNTVVSDTGRSSANSSTSSASSVVGSGFAKVQNMFLRVHEKV